MAKRINLAADSGSDTEYPHYEFMTHLHVVDHVVVVGAGLIMHGPACIQKLETTLSNEATDLLL